MTTPSYSKLTLFCSAKSVSSFFAIATGPLFVVDTCLPLDRAQRQCVVAGCPVAASVTVASITISALLFLMMFSLSAFALPLGKEAKAPSALGKSLIRAKSIPSGE